MQTLNSFADVQAFINKILTDNQEIGDVPNAPHGSFWTALSYHDFTTGDVPGFTGTKILAMNDPDNSNIITVLRGTNPNFPQMPYNGPPYFTDDQIASLADWIKRGCPQ